MAPVRCTDGRCVTLAVLRRAPLACACVLVALPLAANPAYADHGHGNGNAPAWEDEGWTDDDWAEEETEAAWDEEPAPEAPNPAGPADPAAEEDPWGEPWDDSDQDVVLPATPVEALPAAPVIRKKAPGTTRTTGRAANVPYGKLIAATARRHGLSVSLFTALVWQESGFKVRARSRVGAMGLTQLMPATARGLGVKNPWSAAQNLNGGAKYLKTQLRRFGSARLALAAYNAGPGAVSRYRGIPPYAETRNYVKRITGLQARLKKAGVR